MGRNGAGKSTLLSMIAGTTDFESGFIRSEGTISWPVGFRGSFHPDLTGAQNTRFVARVYGVDTDELLEFVQAFSNLGEHFNAPIRSYSSGMRSRLSFGISMGIHFDTYLVDEVTSVGDASFKAKSFQVLKQTAGPQRCNRCDPFDGDHTQTLYCGRCAGGRKADPVLMMSKTGIAKHLENMRITREDDESMEEDS